MRYPNFINTTVAAIVLTATATHYSQAAIFGDFEYTDNGTTITIDEHWNYDKSGPVIVPSAIDGKPVTALGTRAFSRSKKITGVSIPVGVKTVGEYAFSGCGALSSVQLPEGLTTLGGYAFAFCKRLKSIRLPSTLTQASGAFRSGSKLENVTFAPGSTVIPSNVLSDCRFLQTVTLPLSVKRIEGFAFASCSRLETIKLPAGLTYIGPGTFRNCFSIEELIVPPSVTSIGNLAFSGAGLRTIHLSKNIKEIGDGAFERCSALKEVELPAKLTKISPRLFYECYGLEAISLPEGLTRIGESAFQYSAVDRVIFPSKLREIDKSAFRFCNKLRTAVFTGKAPSISNSVFYSVAPNFTIFLEDSATGFTVPRWKGFRTSLARPEITVTAADGSELSFGEKLSLGGAVVGRNGAPRKIIVVNTGIRPLTNLGASVSPKGSRIDPSGGSRSTSVDFVTKGLKKDSLAAGKSVAISVSVTPTKPGKRFAQLVIQSNDNDEGNYIINLSGTGLTEK